MNKEFYQNFQKLENYSEILEKDFASHREKIQKILDSQPKSVSFEEAKQQIERFKKNLKQ